MKIREIRNEEYFELLDDLLWYLKEQKRKRKKKEKKRREKKERKKEKEKEKRKKRKKRRKRKKKYFRCQRFVLKMSNIGF